MMTNKTIVRIAAVSALAFGGLWLAQKQDPGTATDTNSPAAFDDLVGEAAESVQQVDTPALRFVVGEAERYEVSWRSVAASTLAAPDGQSTSLRTLAELDGVLEFTTLEVSARQVTRSVRFESLEHTRFLVDGESHLTGQALVGTELLGVWSPRGELISTRSVEGSPALAAAAFESLLATSQTLVPTPEARRTQVGLARLENIDTPDALRVKQALVSYDELPIPGADGHEVVGETTLTLTPDGRVRTLEFEEELRVTSRGVEALSSNTTLALTYLDSRRVGSLDQLALTAEADGTASELEARAGEWTTERVTQFVSGYDGSDDDTGAFLWSATARTRLDPSAVSGLRDAALAPATPLAGREMALDVLAHAGTDAAQAGLVEALSSELLLADASYPLLLQRVSFVQSPTATTVAFAESALGADTVAHRGAAAYSVGALAATLAESDPATSARLANRLRGALASADPVDAPGLIGGLGNAGLPDDAPLLNGAAADADEEVRIAAAMALHKFNDETSRGTLLSLTSDSSVSVQRVALQSLNNRTFGSADLALLQHNVESGALAQTNYPMLVTVVADSVGDPAGREVLSQVFERAADDARLRARIRGILR